jgi:hypothetical protein
MVCVWPEQKLAVHPKKQAEVHDWLVAALASLAAPQRAPSVLPLFLPLLLLSWSPPHTEHTLQAPLPVLVLSGPAGRSSCCGRRQA